MKPFADYETTQAAGEFEKLPKGAYEVKIEQAKVTTYTGRDGGTFEKLEIAFDIDKGEYAGYYRRNLEPSSRRTRSGKGVLRIYVPKDDGSEKDQWTKRKFKAIIQAIEDVTPAIIGSGTSRLKGKTSDVSFSGRMGIQRKERWDLQPITTLLRWQRLSAGS